MSFRRAFGRLVFLCMFLQVIPFMVFLRKVHAHKHSGPHMRGRQPSGKPNYGCGVITIRHSRQCLNQRTDSVRDVADVCILPDTSRIGTTWGHVQHSRGSIQLKLYHVLPLFKG